MRQQALRMTSLASAAFMTMGCARATDPARDALAAVTPTRDPVCRDAVTSYTPEQLVGAQVQVLAFIDYPEADRMLLPEVTQQVVRRKAARLGATGVVHPMMSWYDTDSQMMAAVFGAATSRTNRSIAVYVPADSARFRLQCDAK